VLALWTGAVALFTPNVPRAMRARVLALLGLVSCGFLLFIIITSNPFERLFPAAAQGRDLNPLLQDIGLAIHPPMLYLGYVGFAVAFAFSIAALISGQVDSAWARWSRPWTNVAWLFLTLGIALGSWWAYYELGWGGWWFWDPVENASFMPWLVGTALMHSLAITEKRGTFKAWTALLAIFAFALSLLGTFLVRSGVLTSVHAFASDPERGVFILGFLVLVVGGSLLLYAWRAPLLKSARDGRQDFGRPALLQPDVYPVDRPARRADRHRDADPLEKRQPAAPQIETLDAGIAGAGAGGGACPVAARLAMGRVRWVGDGRLDCDDRGHGSL
jgi:cytochrome c-type biogenesis protein CcmF